MPDIDDDDRARALVDDVKETIGADDDLLERQLGNSCRIRWWKLPQAAEGAIHRTDHAVSRGRTLYAKVGQDCVVSLPPRRG